MIAWALLATIATALTLDPVRVVRLGSSGPSQKFWHPSRLVVIDETTAAVRVMRSVESAPPAEQRFGFAYTVDAGKSFYVVNDDNDFCGSAGVIVEGNLVCTTSLISFNTSSKVAEFGTVKYVFERGGVFANPSVKKIPGTTQTFTLTGEWDAVGLSIGEVSLFVSEHNFTLRNGVLRLRNGTDVHLVFNSMDVASWVEWSVVPVPVGDWVTINRAGSHKVLMTIGKNESSIEVTSSYLASRWDSTRNVTAAVPVHMFTSPYGSSVYTGAQGRPGLIVAYLGKGSRTPKSFDLTAVHNFFAENGKLDATNFSVEYRNTTTLKGCVDGTSVSDVSGCSSSSFIAMGALTNDTLLMVYDKLSNGFGVSADEGADEVFAVTVFLNETVEIERKRLEDEREQRYERARKQAQKDEEERVKRQRREKLKRERERRTQFAEADKVFIDAAKRESLKDDLIIVRDVNPENLDLEQDTFWDDID